MTHAEYLHQVIAEIAEELPGFDEMEPSVQRTVRELATTYFQEEFVPRLEGNLNIPRYEEAMYEKTAGDRAFIEEQSAFLRSSIVRAQRAAYQQLVETYSRLAKAAKK
jgi:hypothetical protein